MRHFFKHDQSRARRFIVAVNRSDIFYLTTQIETYDDVAVPRALDPRAGLVELLTTVEYEDDARRILEGIGQEIDLRIVYRPDSRR